MTIGDSDTGHPTSGFTLIELLVVIGIIAILAVVLVSILNPAELLRQARDSTRLSDMANLTSALSLFIADTGGTGSLGTVSTAYVSIADPAATSTLGDQCQGLGLPALPSTWTYHCAASSTFQGVNGTGWIPVNLTGISSGSPLSLLPVNPLNTSSTRNYYTYATDGTRFEVTSPMESQRYKLGGSNDVIGPDGGTLATVYEKGSGLGIEPLDYGDSSLVGYWTFDEGSGSTAYDYSGSNATGTLSSPAPTWTTGKVGGALSFNGNNVQVPSTSNLSFGGSLPFTVSAWVFINASGSYPMVINKGNAGGCLETYALLLASNTLSPRFETVSSGTCAGQHSIIVSPVSTLAWHLFTGTFDGTNMILFVDGVSVGSMNISASLPLANSSVLEIGNDPNGQSFNGSIDDVRIYNRALSAAGIAALYANGK